MFIFFLHSSPAPPDLHSFPTRRSSDLYLFLHDALDKHSDVEVRKARGLVSILGERWDQRAVVPKEEIEAIRRVVSRSEEHTSELQSHHDLVCRLLLEKKKERRVAAHTD